MTTLENTIERIGLRPQAAKVYLKLLELGPSRARDVAKTIGFVRQSVYDALAELETKGLISRSPLFAKRFLYHANPPEILADLMRDQLATIEEAIPQLQKLYQGIHAPPQLSQYTGWSAIRGYWREFANTVMQPGTSYESISATEEWYQPDHNFMENFWEPMKIERQITTRLLAAPGWIGEIQAKRPNYQVRILPKQQPFHGDITIYGDSVHFLALEKHDYHMVAVKSAQIARSQRELFEIIWSKSKTFT